MFEIGILILLLVYWKDRKILKFDLDVVGKFLTLMVILTFVRITLASIAAEFGIYPQHFNKGLGMVPYWRLALVFWEDAFFAIPIYYMKDRWQWSKHIWLPIVAVLSIIFGLGHMYQGEWAFFATLLVPYFFFYRFGKRFGFGTTMVCHILFDMITIATFKSLSVVL
jgi:hypothetical protein